MRKLLGAIILSVLSVVIVFVTGKQAEKTKAGLLWEPIVGATFTQPIPFQTMKPHDDLYFFVGTSGDELNRCVAALKIWDVTDGVPAEGQDVRVYCRMQPSGYASVEVYNGSEHTLAPYYSVRVTVLE